LAENLDIPAWIAFFFGLYALAAGVSELRAPGRFLELASEWEHSPGLRFLTGFCCIAVGAAIYLVNPWDLDDPLAMLMTVMGGLVAAEGAAFIAVGDRLMALARRLLGTKGGPWAYLSVALGAIFVLIAFSRIT